MTDNEGFPLRRRSPGCRVKHCVQANWIRTSDMDGFDLRVETVITELDGFRVRRRVRRGGAA